MPLPADERRLARRLDVGRRVRAARLRANLSQGDLAQLAGLDIKTVNRIENGLTSPVLDHLLDIADALGVPPAVLMPGGPEPG
ncbi:helix-turn-helix domain-containing protein [Streptomyces sp. 3MP-14]|uniref:Helix-turn-helix domain-containing protein n=1 Tax=Streptomyces mimosae TaxID=2586635 RepID=A0A5N6A4Z1_9ACTN|nr:helix-turn-helix domain-containing protein [Streptomyces mimosae]KAB8179289.1 helix-turn-helix domain-containing protein [Streptomyces sp. 3MP-14]